MAIWTHTPRNVNMIKCIIAESRAGFLSAGQAAGFVKKGRARGRALKASRQVSGRPILTTERVFPGLPGSNILQLSWCRRRPPRTAASA